MAHKSGVQPMKLIRSLKARLRSSRAEDSGFTMIELVVAIPLSIILLGTVLSTIGFTIALQRDVSMQIGADRVSTAISDKADYVRNCVDLKVALRDAVAAANPDYTATTSYSGCVDGKPTNVSITVKDSATGKLYDTRNIVVSVI